jgi:hypothetical protein
MGSSCDQLKVEQHGLRGRAWVGVQTRFENKGTVQRIYERVMLRQRS